jgi:predicted 3-demethylubiquinone-9 3-methyltransferase (glyoxalase superfamily)
MVLEVSRYGEATPELAGKALIIRFEIEGQQFQALNGGPQFSFNEAISLSVDCADQAEVDDLWARLSEGGSTGRCGWLKDKFGLSWQMCRAHWKACSPALIPPEQHALCKP